MPRANRIGAPRASSSSFTQHAGPTRGTSRGALLLIAALAGCTASLASAAQAAETMADVQPILNSNGCLSCHGVSQRIVGPGFNEIAKKYKGDPKAQATIEASIRDGSSGKWGGSMPPFSALAPDELKALAAYVLKQ